MAAILRTKRSTGSTAPTSLANAEQAFTETDEVLYIGKGTGGSGGSATSVIKIGGKGAFWDKDTVRPANSVLSGPASGSDASPQFRLLQIADLPSHPHTLISDFDDGVRTNRLDQMAVPATSVSMASQRLTNLADPINTQDAATRGFVEATAQGLDVKDSCVVATTADIVISTALNDGDTIDGVTLSNGDRVLVKDQNTATENGIYIVAATPTRAVDLASGSNAAGMFTFIEQGTINADNGFVCTSNAGSAVTATNNLTFAQFSGAGQITTADGLQKTGNTLSVDLKANGGVVIENAEIALDLGAANITVSSAATARSHLLLGTMSTQSANSVNITGGSIDNITLDGGTF